MLIFKRNFKGFQNNITTVTWVSGQSNGILNHCWIGTNEKESSISKGVGRTIQ